MRAVPLVLLLLLAGSPALADHNVVTGDCASPAPDGGRACRTAHIAVDESARVCRLVERKPCRFIDGEDVGPDLVAAYEASWTHRALLLQEQLTFQEPLQRVQLPSTHNTFNAEAYLPTLSGLDPNQVYAIDDQLRMDIRAIELDAHWFPNGTALGFVPVLCHSQDQVALGQHVHAGCSYERRFDEGLREVRAWLDAHPSEVILLYVEDHLDNAQGYDAGAAALGNVLGDITFTPADASRDCSAGRPLDISRAAVRAAGKQVIVVSACGAGSAWRSLVFDYATKNVQNDGFTPYPACGHDRATYGTKWVRYFEDSTWLSAMANGAGPGITAADVAEMTRCGVNMVSLDQLTPNDARLPAFVWSWAQGEPSLVGGCAAQTTGSRFVALSCGDAHPYACRGSDGSWSIVGRGAWAAAPPCFAAPRSGYEQQRLFEARAAITEPVWVALTS